MPENMIDKYRRVRVQQVVSDFYGTVLRSERLARYDTATGISSRPIGGWVPILGTVEKG